jgi:hypothetical protein
LLEIVQTRCRLRLLRLRGKAKVSTDSNKGNTNMTNWTEVTNTALIAKFAGATEIHRSFGVTYLEHPLRGDEAPVYAKVDGKIYNTNDFEIDLMAAA